MAPLALSECQPLNLSSPSSPRTYITLPSRYTPYPPPRPSSPFPANLSPPASPFPSPPCLPSPHSFSSPPSLSIVASPPHPATPHLSPLFVWLSHVFPPLPFLLYFPFSIAFIVLLFLPYPFPTHVVIHHSRFPPNKE